MRKTLAVLMVLAASLAVGCKSRRPAVPAPAEARPEAPPRVDPILDGRAALLSGIPAATEAGRAWETRPDWADFRKSMDEHWGAFDKIILKPMARWAGEELRDVHRSTRTLLYPFGGPDFATAFTLFPDAETIVLMGLEPAGNLPDPEAASDEAAGLFFRDFDDLLADFLKRGYFITKHMNEIYTGGRVSGSLPAVLFFVKRTGNAIVGISRLAPDEAGEWRETPYADLEKRPKRPYGVRIDYLRPGESRTRSVYYFSCDLADKAFTAASPFRRLLAGFDDVSTFVKSASYLLHYQEFSGIRNLILGKSLAVLEDDTGIPYRFFEVGGWAVTLYGAYAKPVADFKGVDQPALREAFADPFANVRTLPFHFGYRWVTRVDNLLLMRRRGGPAEKK